MQITTGVAVAGVPLIAVALLTMALLGAAVAGEAYTHRQCREGSQVKQHMEAPHFRLCALPKALAPAESVGAGATPSIRRRGRSRGRGRRRRWGSRRARGLSRSKPSFQFQALKGMRQLRSDCIALQHSCLRCHLLPVTPPQRMALCDTRGFLCGGSLCLLLLGALGGVAVHRREALERKEEALAEELEVQVRIKPRGSSYGSPRDGAALRCRAPPRRCTGGSQHVWDDCSRQDMEPNLGSPRSRQEHGKALRTGALSSEQYSVWTGKP